MSTLSAHSTSVDSSHAGFRLQYFEVFNWGTFDEHIWSLQPNGQTTLLTGGNGSGKTTLVHALLTLLVPRSASFFRQSTDAVATKERDEKSYFWGEYGTIKEEHKSTATRQRLRVPQAKNGTYSILLAYFTDVYSDQQLTLAGLRWYDGKEIKRKYILAPQALTIKEHFSDFAKLGLRRWKKQLEKRYQAEFFDSFKQYSYRFTKHFGFKSDKAMTLFGKTVGVKVLGNLNTFIRTNMLEESNVNREFERLYQSYKTLIDTYRKIEKASLQKNLLTPIIKDGTTYQELEITNTHLERIKNSVPFYFAHEKKELLIVAIYDKETDLEQKKHQLTTIQEKTQKLRDKKEELLSEKSQHKATTRLNSLDKDIQHIKQRLKTTKKEAAQYEGLAEVLDLPINLLDDDEDIFYDSLKEAKTKQKEIQRQQELWDKEWNEKSIVLKEKQNDCATKERELKHLQQQRTKIPSYTMRIRTKMIEKLGFTAKELPFVGELLKVKDSEKEWEGAIERLLHSFGLTLLVPTAYESEINHYVNHTNLHGRLVYFRVDTSRSRHPSNNKNKDSLIEKLEIKPRHANPFYNYLYQELDKRYDYHCTNDLKEFAQCNKAITAEGLIKGSTTRYEKDDRYNINDPKRYVLGWDNEAKKRAIRGELRRLNIELATLDKDIKEINNRRKELTNKSLSLSHFIQFDNFNKINWNVLQIRLTDLQSERKAITESSNQLKTLNEQIQKTQKQIQDLEKDGTKLIKEETKMETKLSEFRSEQQKCLGILENSPLAWEDLVAKFNHLTPYLLQADYTLDTVDNSRNQTIKKINKELQDNGEEQERLRGQVQTKMMEFKRPTEEVSRKFPSWTSDVYNLGTNVDDIRAYQQLYNKIVTDDLPTFEKRFKKKMNNNVISNIVDFKTYLEKQEDDIERKIGDLNQSLANIHFNENPSTYIELELNSLQVDKAIKDFRTDLKDVMAIYGHEKVSHNDGYFKRTFEKIQALIQKLIEEKDYRKRVTDVRNWFTFAANEKYHSDHTSRRYYEDSKGLSDGQKAKLAYTILVSAIAYQYQVQSPKSFRFVVVDEAFGKVDPTNAAYAMQLFNRFNLQVMIVTPLDKTHVVEEYIGGAHYVQNKTGRHSEVFNLTMPEYWQQKGIMQKM